MNARRIALAVGASLAFAAAIAPQASACREYSPTEEQLAELPVIINVTVLRAEKVESPDLQVWRIVAQGHREPDAPPSEFEFYAALATASCPRLPLPKPGDPWILRLTDPASTEYDTAYPLGYPEALKAEQDKWDAENGGEVVIGSTPPPDAADTADPPPAPRP
jgi:hypothetical protein